MPIVNYLSLISNRSKTVKQLKQSGVHLGSVNHSNVTTKPDRVIVI